MPEIPVLTRILFLSAINLLILIGAFALAVVAPMLLVSLQSRKKWWLWLVAYLTLVLPFLLVALIWAVLVLYGQGQEGQALTLAVLPVGVVIILLIAALVYLWREARTKNIPINRALPRHFIDDITHPLPPGIDLSDRR
jgi:hypothetical protein